MAFIQWNFMHVWMLLHMKDSLFLLNFYSLSTLSFLKFLIHFLNFIVLWFFVWFCWINKRRTFFDNSLLIVVLLQQLPMPILVLNEVLCIFVAKKGLYVLCAVVGDDVFVVYFAAFFAHEYAVFEIFMAAAAAAAAAVSFASFLRVVNCMFFCGFSYY